MVHFTAANYGTSNKCKVYMGMGTRMGMGMGMAIAKAIAMLMDVARRQPATVNPSLFSKHTDRSMYVSVSAFFAGFNLVERKII